MPNNDENYELYLHFFFMTLQSYVNNSNLIFEEFKLKSY
jgi:hypothetical protein